MQEDIKTEWIDRLRSGKYLQGKGFLRQRELGAVKHCCLGILCEMAIEAGVTAIVEQRSEEDRCVTMFGNPSSAYGDVLEEGIPTPSYAKTLLYTVPWNADKSPSYLPKAVAEWAELTANQQYVLARMNDELTPFDDIADHIKNHIF